MKEEGEEYENAAYYGRADSTHGEAQVVPALLVQPLGDKDPSGSKSEQNEDKTLRLATLCEMELRTDIKSSAQGACTEYVHWYSGIEKAAKTGWHIVKAAAVGAYRAMGAGDPYSRREVGAGLTTVQTFYDGYQCLGGDCQGFSQDLAEY